MLVDPGLHVRRMMDYFRSPWCTLLFFTSKVAMRIIVVDICFYAVKIIEVAVYCLFIVDAFGVIHFERIIVLIQGLVI